MKESFLHFIWQFQKFDASHLVTHVGQPVQIYSIGQYNTDSGPDFLNAKILIDDITWYGNVEIHLKSSDWDNHAHQNDEAYNNVILHVVWSHDKDVRRLDGEKISVIELQPRVKPELLKRCNELLKSPDKIPCQSLIHKTRKIDIISMMEHAGVYRLENKSRIVLDKLQSNRGSWEETAYQVLAQNFGFKVNEEPFSKLSRDLQHKILIKHAGSQLAVEALLFGMAGFLPTKSDDTYVSQWIKEFEFLAKKYSLADKALLKVEWKFLRMRPGNFPTVRLSQFASFVSRNVKFFDTFINFTTVEELVDMFCHEPSQYWREHYDFGKVGKRKNMGMGRSSVEVLLINTVAPLLAAYAQHTNNEKYMEKAIDLLQTLKSEKNRIVDDWSDLGLSSKNAFDSQSLISLRNDFCLKSKCLSCKIGLSLINR